MRCLEAATINRYIGKPIRRSEQYEDLPRLIARSPKTRQQAGCLAACLQTQSHPCRK